MPIFLVGTGSTNTFKGRLAPALVMSENQRVTRSKSKIGNVKEDSRNEIRSIDKHSEPSDKLSKSEADDDDDGECYGCGVCDMWFGSRHEVSLHLAGHVSEAAGEDIQNLKAEVPTSNENSSGCMQEEASNCTRDVSSCKVTEERQDSGTYGCIDSDLSIDIKYPEPSQPRDIPGTDVAVVSASDEHLFFDHTYMRTTNQMFEVKVSTETSLDKPSESPVSAESSDLQQECLTEQYREEAEERKELIDSVACNSFDKERSSHKNQTRDDINASEISVQQTDPKEETSKPESLRHTCSFCGLSFSGQSNLIKHERTHTGERPFVCETCGKSFPQKIHLDVHSLTHTGQRPHTCKTCGKGFVTTSSLKTHQIVHTKDKPFSCSHCEFTSGYKSTLLRHLATHHGVKKSASDIPCPVREGESKEETFKPETLPKERCDDINPSEIRGQQIDPKEGTSKPESLRHTCSFCGLSCARKSNLKKHERTHTGERPFVCETCGKSFVQKHHLDYHSLTHTGERAHTCKTCGKRFATTSALKIHQIVHTKKKPFSCSYCEYTSGYKSTLLKHLAKHHGIKKFASDIPCPVREVESKVKSAISSVRQYRRSRDQDKPRPFACRFCDRWYAHRDALKTHLKKHPENMSYTCCICDETLTIKQDLESHLEAHSADFPHPCDSCSRKFRSRDELQDHKKLHVIQRRISCNECSASFTMPCLLKIHMKKHTGERPYACHICNARFGFPSNLKFHLKAHLRIGSFNCNMCQKIFSTHGEFAKHKVQVHSEHDQLVCSVCGKKCSNGSSLRVHMSSHSGKRSFSCDVCEAVFNNKGNLVKHKRTHTGERPFPCKLCQARFSSTSNLRRHEQAHRAEKPHACTNCAARFANRFSLKHHQKTKHNSIIK